MKKLPSSNNFVSTDKAKNLYKISKENYSKLLYYISRTYKKPDTICKGTIDKEATTIAKSFQTQKK